MKELPALFTIHPDFIEGFSRVCYDRGISMEKAAELHYLAVDMELSEAFPEFAEGFKSELRKQASIVLATHAATKEASVTNTWQDVAAQSGVGALIGAGVLTPVDYLAHRLNRQRMEDKVGDTATEYLYPDYNLPQSLAMNTLLGAGVFGGVEGGRHLIENMDKAGNAQQFVADNPTTMGIAGAGSGALLGPLLYHMMQKKEDRKMSDYILSSLSGAALGGGVGLASSELTPGKATSVAANAKLPNANE